MRFRRLALVCFLGAGWLVLAAGCYSSPNVTGEVTSTGSRYKRTQERGGQEKIALRLSPFQAPPDIAELAGASGLDVECLSTRCATLKSGECVELACYESIRLGEPNVVSCKMNKTVKCQ